MTTTHRSTLATGPAATGPAAPGPAATGPAAPGPQQLAFLLPLAGGSPANGAKRHATAVRGASAAPAVLSLVVAELPAQLRLDRRTRSVGRAGIAELRRILADGAASAA